jgi:hypothetical protein
VRRLLSWLLPLIAVTGIGLCAWNVFSDSTSVEALARVTACSGQGAGCAARVDGAYVKTPFFHDLSLRTSPERKVDVRCMRAYVLLGDHSCTVKPR